MKPLLGIVTLDHQLVPPFDMDTLVVSQGNHASLHDVNQLNYGGSGGFARCIKEFLDNSKYLTHDRIILSDDDVEYPLGFERKISSISLSENEIMGGAMCSINDCDHIYELGGQAFAKPFEQRPYLFGNANEIDFSSANAGNIDYFGWWCCSYSRKALEELGYPLPLFIRHDDLEYGLRAKKAGYKFTAHSDFKVAHPPFHSKRPTWITYYHIRNGMIVQDMYKNFSALEIWKKILNLFEERLFLYDYGGAHLLILALEHYLKGPVFLFGQRPDKHHQHITDSYQAWNESSSCNSQNKLASSSANIPSNPIFRKLFQNGHNFPKSLLSEKTIGKQPAEKWRKVGFSKEIIIPDSTGKDDTKFWNYPISYKKHKDLTKHFHLLRRLFFKNHKMQKAEWNKLHSKKLISQYWENMFSISDTNINK